MIISGERNIDWEINDNNSASVTLPVDTTYALLVDTEGEDVSYTIAIEIK